MSAARDRSQMRTGFTTGASACAAACAAVQVLTEGALEPWAGPLPELTADRYDVLAGQITITIPCGERVRFAVRTACVQDTPEGPEARCSVIKDGGDDPDCTHRGEIWAAVRLTERAGEVALARGEGVGQVTRPGLGLAVGAPAINPVPRRNITEQVRALLPDGRGAHVTVGVIGGAAMARKTLNARLGILGGISILGTTGIVRPYSTAAFRASVTKAIDVAHELGLSEIIVTTGGRSERFGQALRPDLAEPAFVQMGDFVGHALHHAAARGMGRVTICGMMGKLSKMADGKTMTHAKGSKVNMDLLSALAQGVGVAPAVCDEIRTANTGRHVAELVRAAGRGPAFFAAICERVEVVLLDHLCARWPSPPELCVLFVDFSGELLARWPAHALTPWTLEPHHG